MSAEMCVSRCKKGAGHDSLPLLPGFFGEKHQRRHRPDAKDETKDGPEILRVTIVVSEQAAHNAVEKMDHQGST